MPQPQAGSPKFIELPLDAIIRVCARECTEPRDLLKLAATSRGLREAVPQQPDARARLTKLRHEMWANHKTDLLNGACTKFDQLQTTGERDIQRLTSCLQASFINLSKTYELSTIPQTGLRSEADEAKLALETFVLNLKQFTALERDEHYHALLMNTKFSGCLVALGGIVNAPRLLRLFPGQQAPNSAVASFIHTAEPGFTLFTGAASIGGAVTSFRALRHAKPYLEFRRFHAVLNGVLTKLRTETAQAP